MATRCCGVVGAAVKTAVKEAGIGLLKGLGKETVKRRQAEVIEGGAYDDYMNAQIAFGQAVANLQYASDKYWANEDAISILSPTYEGLMERNDTGFDLIETRSEQLLNHEDWTGVPGWRIPKAAATHFENLKQENGEPIALQIRPEVE